MTSRGGGRNRIKDAQVPDGRQSGSWKIDVNSRIAGDSGRIRSPELFSRLVRISMTDGRSAAGDRA
jgi:hypothetical protein